MFWTVGFLLALSSLVLWFGLNRSAMNPSHAPLPQMLAEGVKAAANPRVVLAYLAGFSSRGDSIVVTTFLSLWVTGYERSRGATVAQALAAAGTISGVAQTVALVAAVPWGLLCDHLDRALCQTLAALVAGGAYAALFFLPDPTGWPVYLVASAVGLGEIGMIVCAQVLVAAEAPRASRGSVAGVFGLLGSVSVLLTSQLGGHLFDTWRVTAPFVLVAVANGLVALLGIGCLIHALLTDTFSWWAPHVGTPPTSAPSAPGPSDPATSINPDRGGEAEGGNGVQEERQEPDCAARGGGVAPPEFALFMATEHPALMQQALARDRNKKAL